MTPRVGRGESAVVDGRALIPGVAATQLVRILDKAGWRLMLPPGMHPLQRVTVEEAVEALRAAAAETMARAQDARLAPGASEQGQPSADRTSSEQWIPTREAATIIGVSSARVRQLSDEGKLNSVLLDGGRRRVFERASVLRQRQRTATSRETRP
jgi:hypothetical protein